MPAVSSAPPKIFLSYRRDDAGAIARTYYEALDERFPGRVFLDVAEVEPGVDFVAAIDDAIRASGVVVVLIGPRWMALDAAGRARIHDERDYVRREIASALLGERRIVPVALPGGSMPRPSELPADVARLSHINAMSSSASGVEQDVRSLVDLIERHFGEDRDRVRLSGMLTNQGWLVNFNIQDLDVSEIVYRLDAASEFRSTGSEAHRDRATGKAFARRCIDLPLSVRRQPIELRYTDSRGHEHGPYALTFDAELELVRSTRSILDSTPQWLAFDARGQPGLLLVHFSHLVSYKAALREIRFWVDDDTLGRSLHFARVDGDPSFEIGSDDETLVEVPAATNTIRVQLTYIDGTQSETVAFAVRDQPSL